MKRTVRENIHAEYSLHDMHVTGLEAENDTLRLKLQSGMIKTAGLGRQTEGYVEFQKVQWDFSYVYLMDLTGNEGEFSGGKMFLRRFISEIQPMGFTVMDETYGYNMTKYSGYLIANHRHYECFIEIYHEGDMIFVSEE